MDLTIYDNEILIFIENRGFSNIINIEEHFENVIKRIEDNYVMGFNGIDWGQNEIIISRKFNSEKDKYLEEAKLFLDSIVILFPHFLNQNVIVIGDNLTNLSYSMKFESFLFIFDQFLSIPQHTYIWFENSKKCINFTFNNEVYFG